MHWLNLELAILVGIGSFFVLPALLALFFNNKAPASYQFMWALTAIIGSWLGYFLFRQLVFLPWKKKHHLAWQTQQKAKFNSDQQAAKK